MIDDVLLDRIYAGCEISDYHGLSVISELTHRYYLRDCHLCGPGLVESSRSWCVRQIVVCLMDHGRLEHERLQVHCGICADECVERSGRISSDRQAFWFMEPGTFHKGFYAPAKNIKRPSPS